MTCKSIDSLKIFLSKKKEVTKWHKLINQCQNEECKVSARSYFDDLHELLLRLCMDGVHMATQYEREFSLSVNLC
jgi:hypothetical protein